jgi:phospholipase C
MLPLLAAGLCAACGSSSAPATLSGGPGNPASCKVAGNEAQPPPIKHVFLIVLENESFDDAFGPASPATYLSQELPRQGQLLPQYYGIGHASLDNYVAMVSGQAPNVQTQGDCVFYTDFVALPLGLDANGQVAGTGCVYPANVPTVVDQLEAAGFSWKGYMEDMAATPGEPATCRHPALNSMDSTQSARAEDQYAVRHNPFMYFHSIIDDAERCDAHVVDLENLRADLGSTTTTPNYVFITPDLCSDGHDTDCVDGRPGGLVSADEFLKEWVPLITASPAFRDSGLLLVYFDESGFTGAEGATACCGETFGPNTPLPGLFGPGGGRSGAVLLSQYTQPGSVNDTAYNHYSLLRSIENLFGLDYIGFAKQSGLKAFGEDVYNCGG